jgi:hypothetical protein
MTSFSACEKRSKWRVCAGVPTKRWLTMSNATLSVRRRDGGAAARRGAHGDGARGARDRRRVPAARAQREAAPGTVGFELEHRRAGRHARRRRRAADSPLDTPSANASWTSASSRAC